MSLQCLLEYVRLKSCFFGFLVFAGFALNGTIGYGFGLPSSGPDPKNQVYSGCTFDDETFINTDAFLINIDGAPDKDDVESVTFINCTFEDVPRFVLIQKVVGTAAKLGVSFDNCTFKNQIDAANPGINRVAAINISDCEYVRVHNCKFTDINGMIRVTRCKNVTVSKCESITPMRQSGIELRENCENVWILNNTLRGFVDGFIGGHVISTQRDSDETPRGDSVNININRNKIYGADVAWVRSPADPNAGPDDPLPPGEANGATGDMLAIKSVDGFTAIGNVLHDSGEYGLTCIGCKNGRIVENEIVRSDGSGIAIINACNDVEVLRNTVTDAGANRAGGVTYQAGIRVFDGAGGGIASPEDITIRDNILNKITSDEFRYGLLLSHQSQVNLGFNSYIGSFDDAERIRVNVHQIDIDNNTHDVSVIEEPDYVVP